MPLHRPALVVLTSLAVVVPGCGGSKQKAPEDAAKQAVRDYLNAFADGDGAAACGLLTEPVRVAFVAKVSGAVNTTDCAQAITRIRATLSQSQADALKAIRVRDAKIHGSRGSVLVEANGQRIETKVLDVGGNWKVNQPPEA